MRLWRVATQGASGYSLDMQRPAPHNAPRASGLAFLDISHAGETYRINLRRLASARRFTLRVRAAAQDVVLTMPARGSLAEAKAFAARHAAWIGARLRRLPQKIPFRAGELVPLRGVMHQIAHRPGQRGGIWIEEARPGHKPAPLLCVGAEAPFVARRVRDYLMLEARRDITAAVKIHSVRLGAAPRKIVLKDTVSRWGSCSSAGTLNFSWRLIMAPPFVLDYLAAHETAHLLHMNHSSAFWAAVGRATQETARAEAWLKAHGPSLLRFGSDPDE